ncbi:type II toxin-antitoxin system RelE/ParE family toxin [Olsenella sp. kh2p3]|uniref:type II toxin-antitoxin system RelE/ParE family toxin n=1 Tax=Olsenella sp. kh2p3 TaxID=1797112 RepID=UPI0009F80E08|nr:type II toxin-antitoxin system RelE/ParE family toxin [Olsenella sp. kh2p3]
MLWSRSTCSARGCKISASDRLYSIRVNDQWRICFTWRDGEAKGVEFCDYHS